MRVIEMCAAATALLVMTATEGGADCCWPDFRFKPGKDNDLLEPTLYVTGCGDCTDPTPFCGYGKCNIFGCNCDGGCRTGGCSFAPTGTSNAPTRTDALTLLINADTDNNGSVTVEEATAFLISKGRSVTHGQVRAMDKNGDGFITANEIDG